MKRLYLIDWNSFIYRMFFALPEFATKDWTIVNALFGMAKFFALTLAKENPDYLVFMKDAKWENFRHQIWSDYKATRHKMPDALITQIPLIEEMIGLMNIKIVEISGFEADDIIWTLATSLGKEKDFEIDILTGDKDLYSLVSSNVRIYDTMKKKKFWPKEAKEKFGVESNMIIDYLAIVWDSSDNIPWIPGFWPEKAVKLINHIWWIKEIFDLVEEINSSKKAYTDLAEEVQFCFKWKTFEKLASAKEIAFLSKQLATVKLDVPLEDFDIEDFKFEKNNLVNENVIEFFEKYEFNSLVWEEKVVMKLQNWNDLGLKVHIIDNDENLFKLKEACLNEKELVLDTETTSLDIMSAELTWISIYLDDERIYYINRLHYWNRVSDEALKSFLTDILASPLLIVWHNLKYDLEVLKMFLKWEWNKNKGEGTMQTSLF